MRHSLFTARVLLRMQEWLRAPDHPAVRAARGRLHALTHDTPEVLSGPEWVAWIRERGHDGYDNRGSRRTRTRSTQ